MRSKIRSDTDGISRRLRHMLVAFLVTSLMVLPVAGVSLYILDSLGETLDASYVAEELTEHGGLYGTALHLNTGALKSSLYVQRRPTVVAIGSSRSLGFRQAFFTEPFLTFGGAVDGLPGIHAIVQEDLAAAAPDIVILAVEFAWLNRAYIEATAAYRSAARSEEGDVSVVDVGDAFVVPRWLAEGRLSLRSIYRSLRDRGDGARYFGVQAIENGAGFARDGSFFDIGRTVSICRNPSRPERFLLNGLGAARSMVQAGGRSVDPELWQSYLDIVDAIRAIGAEPVTVLPPLWPGAVEAIAARPDTHGYVEDMRHKMQNAAGWHFDFHDVATLGLDECVFWDGLHAGDVAYAHMLLTMTEDGDSPLAAVVDRDRLTAFLDHATDPTNLRHDDVFALSALPREDMR